MALGLYFTPQVTALVAEPVVGDRAGDRLGAGAGLGVRPLAATAVMPAAWAASREQQRATSYFAGAIGGASEMTLLAERAGARTDLVAAAHSLRLLIVTLSRSRSP